MDFAYIANFYMQDDMTDIAVFGIVFNLILAFGFAGHLWINIQANRRMRELRDEGESE